MKKLGLLWMAFQGFGLLFSDPVFAGDERPLEIRTHRSKFESGVYLQARENRSFVTSLNPLASVSREGLAALLREHPDLENHRIVLKFNSLFEGRDLVREIKMTLRDLGLPHDVMVYREPSGSLEKVLDRFPRTEDWERPLPTETRQAHLVTSSFVLVSFGLLTYFHMMDKVSALTLGSMTALAATHIGSAFYPQRFWSIYFNRLSGPERYLVNFIYAFVFSTPAYQFMNGHVDFAEVATQSLFSSLTMTSLTTAIFLWENSEKNVLDLNTRRQVRAKLYTSLHFLITPLYILGMSSEILHGGERNEPSWLAAINSALWPVSEHLFRLNEANLGMISLGLMGAVAWASVDPIAHRSSRLLEGATSLKMDLKAGCRILLGRLSNKILGK